MKILKYKKDKNNLYEVTIDSKSYKLYDDIIIKYELLRKKELTKKELEEVLKENDLLQAYYVSLKSLSIKMRCEKEIREILKKKEYDAITIDKTITKLKSEKYLNHETYIEAYIHDRLALYMEGEKKILNDLKRLGFKENEIKNHLDEVDQKIYEEKIKKFIDKKLKANKKSANEFKRKILSDLITKGFNKESIILSLEQIEIKEDKKEIEKIIQKLYSKYISKYDIYIAKNKIHEYLYRKGYQEIDIDEYIKKISN